jgi:DNA-binding NtrC family response regulator
MTFEKKEVGDDLSSERVLLVDDNPANLQILFEALKGLGCKLLVAKGGEQALRIAQTAMPSVILLDIVMPEMDGFEVCQRLKEDKRLGEMAVIFLSALDEVEDKVRGLEMGAIDFITKPFQASEVMARVRTQLTIQRLKRELRQRNEALQRELRVAQTLLQEAYERTEGPLVGESLFARHLRDHIQEAAQRQDALLIVGQPGVGHEAVARAIHRASTRRLRPFLHINCATLQSSRVKEIFGSHRDEEDREEVGTFFLAQGGTLYLERIHALLPEVQHALEAFLQKIQAGEITLDGAPVDVRLLSSSTLDMLQQLREGHFRKGLFTLLCQAKLSIPSLFERREDLPMLARFFLQQATNKQGKVVKDIAQESLEALQRHPWPGNLHEMRSLIEREVALCQGTILHIDEATLVGSQTMGGYQLIEKIGEGGMGEVWKAQHHLLGRPAAIKLIRVATSTEEKRREEAFRRFRREARAMAQLQSPHTVSLYDFGANEEGTFFYAMELLDGIDLQRLVMRYGALPPERVIHLLKHACLSLEEAHRIGLIHRDIKPPNLLTCHISTEYDHLKVLDFGIVKARVTTDKQPVTGDTNKIVGTPGYISPEALLGKGELDGRADLYALGCVAYWLLTGEEVFVSDNPLGIMVQHLHAVPEPPSIRLGKPLPPLLEHSILQCLQKDPAKRPISALALWELLDAVPSELPWTRQRARAWWETFATSPISSQKQNDQESTA